MNQNAELNQPTQGYWTEGPMPANARVGEGSVIMGGMAFKRFHTHRDPGVTVGRNCTLDGIHFAINENGQVAVGDYCYLMATLLLCELEIQIGNYVVIGWNTTITDSDFHPLDPALRVADAIAISKGTARPPIQRKPVIIEDDVWIGASATILKGVRIGRGSYIEAGSVVTHDVPPGSRVAGNPAQVIGPMEA